MQPGAKKFIIGGLLLAILAILVFSSFTTVPAGHRGVLVQLGAVKPTVLDEGINFKLPFVQTVIPMEVRVKKAEDSQAASTKDLQTVKTTMSVNYHLEPSAVNKVYQEIGLDYENRIIDPAISEALKAITSLYQADELISKREEVSQRVKETLSQKINKYHIVLSDINIREFSFSDEFNESIEAKQKAEQLALKAKRDLERIQIEAQQKVEQAQAEAKALQLKKQEVTPELVQLKQIEVQERALDVQAEAIKRWDGKLPNVTGGATPFVDINQLLGTVK
ncbi:prohibitin family protein [Bacillus sp. 165]|uniref:prohibitin family protein n=1 Tax=Bacillus sp. 165 TaxID=1529117 RepID=UPI001ADAC45C|nr:prohibitin family protein [Bacillus sp. 165]MBO9128429.1 prohibitin family protein [Bacillus sp. 165]